MKTIIFLFVLSLLTTVDFAQSNNPYNQTGVDYVASLQIISNDVNAGKVKEFNESTIQYYSGIIPLKCKANTEMASAILRTIKTKGFKFSEFIDNSALPEVSKQTFKEICFPAVNSTEEYKLLLTSKVNEINGMEIPASEKEMLLSMIAIAYNVTPDVPINNNVRCEAFGPEGSYPVSCTFAGAILGGTLGYALCGLGCALGGAIIGGIIGSLC